MAKKFLTAEWNNLIMANYVIDPEILKPYIPPKTELDVFNGKVYVSLIGFMFNNTRLLGIKIPFHVNFEEVNLRFYVRYDDHGVWKRGAVFIKEIVPKAAISIVANTIYREKYNTMQMSHFFKETSEQYEFGYHWKYKNKWNRLEAVTEKKALAMMPGSEEEFIAEHYWGYSKYSNSTTFEYAVQHPAWNVYPVKSYLIDCDFTGLYGHAFSFLQHAKPQSVFVAQGSPVAVLHKRNI
jgi:uncharacterized protein